MDSARPAGRDHLLDLGRGDHIGIGAETPFRLVDAVEMGEARRQDRGTGLDRLAVLQPGLEVAGIAVELVHGRAEMDISSRCPPRGLTMPPMASLAHSWLGTSLA
jgi:hypothetical protein